MPTSNDRPGQPSGQRDPWHLSFTPRRRALLQGAFAAAVAVPGSASAAWPERPVEIVVATAPGGGVDLAARIAARFLDKHMPNRGFVVVNRPGAGGEVGFGAVADARPDGYTLALLTAPNILAIPIERQAPRFRVDSFDLIANLADDPATISVHASSRIRSIADLIAALKANPGGLTYGTAGIGALGHIAMMSLGRATGITAEHVPFQGAAPVATALLGRQIDIATSTFAEALAFARGSADWRVLGVMSPERLRALPDAPTFNEVGIAVEVGSQRGFGAPRGTPPAVLASLAEALDKVVADPEYLAAMEQAAMPVRYMKRDTYAAHLAQLDANLRALWQTNPWRQS